MEVGVQTGWNDPRSYLQKGGSNEMVSYRGVYYLHDTEFKVYINQQKTGKYLLRGRITAMSPVDGFALQVVGAEKKRRIEKVKQKENEKISVQSGNYRNKALNVTSEFYCQSLDEKSIRLAISNAAIKLYTKNADLILRRQKQSVKPDTITLAIATALYANEYVTTKHCKTNEKTQKSYVQWLIAFGNDSPNQPMAKCKKSKMEQFLAENRIGNHKRGLLAGFWGFCLLKGICEGSNPIQDASKRKLSPQAKQAKALIPQELTLSQQDQLFEYLVKNISGSACGVALQLWGGFSCKTACVFHWSDVLFSSAPDLVRIKYYLDDNAGATHDYTRPLFVQAARILIARHEQLKRMYSLGELEKLPIVCQQKNPKKVMTANELTQYSSMMLRQIGVTEDILAALRMPKSSVSGQILHNTYVSNLVHRCGLASDPGTVKFLCGESLTDSVTDDHYTSFTSPSAVERIHTALKAVAPLEELTYSTVPVQEAGIEVQVIAPEHTRQRVGIVEETILKPGAEIEIICPHGVSGSISARAVDEYGNRKRAVRKKQT